MLNSELNCFPIVQLFQSLLPSVFTVLAEDLRERSQIGEAESYVIYFLRDSCFSFLSCFQKPTLQNVG